MLRKNFSKQCGMTLLEVLVATSIMAVIASLAFLSLDNLANAKQSLDEKTQILNQANLTQIMLQTDVQMAISNISVLKTVQNFEFTGNSQGFTLIRYRNAAVLSGRETKRDLSKSQYLNQPMMRVRWFVRNNQWYRATQSAFSPLNSNQWVERPMMALQSLNCNYQNKAGLVKPSWPSSQIEQGELPDIVSCQIQTDTGQRSVINVVPWQNLGFL